MALGKKNIFSFIFLIGSLVALLLFFGKDEIYRLLSQATGAPASLVVDTQFPLGELPQPWKHLAQGGEDLTTDMIGPVIQQTRALAPQTIRLDHLYDGYNVVSRGENGQLLFNWTRLDQVVNSIRQAGATPMLSLSYMPPAIAEGSIVDKPKDWNDWALVVQNTVQHYSGDLSIPNIAYEVWNEPDLFGGWKAGKDKNYLELYRWSVLGASRATNVQPFKIGGPATTAPYSAWVSALLKFVQDNNVRLDFLSWHRYSKNINDFRDDLAVVDRELLKFPTLAARLERYVTEWGPNGENDAVYDTSGGAAHLVAVVRAILGQIDRLYTFEIVDGKDVNGQALWGRWGLMTHPSAGSQIKPRYQAIQLLNRLNGIQLKTTGEGSWVTAIATRSAGGDIQVLAVNYDESGQHTETTPLKVSGMAQGTYTLSRDLLGGGSSKTNATADPNGDITTSLPLPANSVSIIEIHKVQ